MSSMVKKRRQGPCPCCVGSLPSRCYPGWREQAERREAQRDLKPENWWPQWTVHDVDLFGLGNCDVCLDTQGEEPCMCWFIDELDGDPLEHWPVAPARLVSVADALRAA